MGDAQGAQGALEFALGIAVIVTGAGAKEAQPIRVNGQWNTVRFKGAAEMLEVVPSGLRRDETACHVEPGVVINGEQEELLARGRPPLVNGAIVLPEIANFRAAETSVAADFSRCGGEKMSKVDFDVSLDAGTRTLEATESFHFITDELKVRRILQGQKALKERVDLRGPGAAVRTATRRWLEALAPGQPGTAQLVKPGLADAEQSCGTWGVEQAGVEI